MSVTGTQSTTSILGSASPLGGVSQGGQTSSTNSLDMNAFLTMFTTQLKCQDPTNPLQSYELASQLAQFSTVEKLTQVNSNLKGMETYLASLNNGQMIGLIGKEITGLSNAIQVQGGQASTVNYKLETAGQVTVKVFDQDSNLVRTISLGSQDVGSHEIKWDGLNDLGQSVVDGQYSCTVQAFNANGQAQEIAPTVHGKVYSVRMEQGVPYLILNGESGVKMSMNEIVEIIESGGAYLNGESGVKMSMNEIVEIIESGGA